jgi:DNA-directed RNA polymerase subunit RPC12/RpoP
MIRIVCPHCRGRQFYFDIPLIEHPINLCLERGKFVIRRQVDNKPVRRTLRNKNALKHYIRDKTWSWTCSKCGEMIDSSYKQWRSLRKVALKYLK